VCWLTNRTEERQFGWFNRLHLSTISTAPIRTNDCTPDPQLTHNFPLTVNCISMNEVLPSVCGTLTYHALLGYLECVSMLSVISAQLWKRVTVIILNCVIFLYVVIECRTAEKESTKAKVGRNFYGPSFGYLRCVFWISITFPCDSPHFFVVALYIDVEFGDWALMLLWQLSLIIWILSSSPGTDSAHVWPAHNYVIKFLRFFRF